MTQDYAFVTTSPAYVWDYRSADIYNNRMNKSATLKIDYRFNPAFRVFLNGIYNDAHERSFEYLRTRAFTARTVAPLNAAGQPTGNNAILANFTDQITHVRPVAASIFELQTDGNRFEDSQRQLHTGAEHTYARLTLDYDASYSESLVRQNDGHHNPKIGSGGFFRTWLTGVGWTLDKSANEMRPRFTQTGGPSIFDLKNYTNSELNKRDNERNGILEGVSANLKNHFDSRGTNYLKTGARFRRQIAEEVGGDRRWQYAGPDGILGVNSATGRNDGDLSIFLFKDVNDQTQTLTVGNPALKPQFAANLDFTLEYYFEPVGAFSVGVFRKELRDFIVSLGGQTVPNGPDNGFGGSYGGYNLITDLNAGRARIKGIELSYQQQLTFLPGALRRLSFFARSSNSIATCRTCSTPTRSGTTSVASVGRATSPTVRS